MGKITTTIRWSIRAAEFYAATKAVKAAARALHRVGGAPGIIAGTPIKTTSGVSKGRLVSGAIGGAAVGRLGGPVGMAIGAAVGAAWAARSGK